MPRACQNILKRYRGLEDIPESEWDDFFPNTDKPWSQEDLEYLIEWWGKDDVVSLAYALGRPPWGLQRTVSRLRKRGVHISYQRQCKEDEALVQHV